MTRLTPALSPQAAFSRRAALLAGGSAMLLGRRPHAKASGRGRLASVVGEVLILEDGTRLRLAELAPTTLHPADRFPATDAILRYRVVASAPDRTEAWPAVVQQDGAARSLQEDLVAAGEALVFPTKAADFARTLLVLERQARKARQGLWATTRFRIEPAMPPPPTGRFAIVADRVYTSAVRRQFIYLNYGANWRTDLAVRVRRDDARTWGIVDALRGAQDRSVEVRGWVFEAGGPMLEPHHPLQLRFAS